MDHVINLDQGSSSRQLNADRYAQPCLAALFALAVVLNLSRAGEAVVLCARLLFTLSSAVYVAVRLLRRRGEGWSWSWSGRAEAWCAAKECAASAAGYCRRNYTRVTYYVVILLYGTALLFTDGGADSRYVSVVSLLAPALIAVAKVVGDSRGDHGNGSPQQIPQHSAILGVAAEQRAEAFIS